MSRIKTGHTNMSNFDSLTDKNADITGLAFVNIENFPEHVFWEHFVKHNADDEDGRSQVVQIRFPNGDLFLGYAPQGDTYSELEEYYL